MTARTVETLLVEQELIDLTIRYTWALDHRRFEDLHEVFAPDGTADYGQLGIFTGPDAIGGACATALARYDRTQHLVSNHQISLNGDRASGRCYLQAQHVRKEGGVDHNFILAGSYLDEFRRTDDGWRIAARALRTTWTSGQPPTAPAECDTSFVISGWIDIDPANVDELMAAAVVMMRASEEEPGCLAYAFSVDRATAGRIRIFERWRSEADLRGHFDTPHMTVFRQALGRAGVKGRDLSRFHVNAVGPVF